MSDYMKMYAVYEGKPVNVLLVDSNKKYCLVTYSSDETKIFKVDIESLTEKSVGLIAEIKRENF